MFSLFTCWVILHVFVVCCCFFSNLTFSKNSFGNTIRVSKVLDPGQARRFFGPDLRPNSLQRLSAEDTGRKRVNRV